MTEKKQKLKKRIRRCWGILVSALTQKGFNRNMLAEKYGCSTRMISQDIALLREIGFPIRYTKSGYTLSVDDLEIPPLPLDKEQVLTLFIASQLLVLTPLEQEANEAVQKMLSVLKEDIVTFLRNLTDRVYIAPGGDLGDTKILFDVYRAVSECRSIQIHYQALSTQQEEIWDVDPCGIYIKDRARSYLIGHTYENSRIYRRFKLCRITHLKFRGMGFTYPPEFSIRKEMATGFWDGEQEYEVVIRFRPEVAQLVREREPAERIEIQPGGVVLVRKTVRNLDEAFYEIRRYRIEEYDVLEPPELIEMLRKEYEFGYKKFCQKVKTNHEITTF